MNHVRWLFLTLLGTALLASVLWFVPSLDTREAALVPALGESRVAWSGTVIGVMESGGMVAVRRPDGVLFAASLVHPFRTAPEGRVTVTGYRAGDTCAYRNTVFGGTCVPYLERAEVGL